MIYVVQNMMHFMKKGKTRLRNQNVKKKNRLRRYNQCAWFQKV